MKARRQLIAWAIDADFARQNPARDVPYLRPTNPDGWHTWTPDEVTTFEARHRIGTKARLALALLLFTGVRRSDVVRLGRQMERKGGTWIAFEETKGQSRHRKARELPILPELRAIIDAAPSGDLDIPR